MNFHKMVQEEGETITHFVARLKSQAFLCKFEAVCSCNPTTKVSYADKMVAQRLVAGLRNIDHHRKILAEASTLKTLEEKIKRLQLLETTEESAGVLHGAYLVKPSVATAVRSQYKKSRSIRGQKDLEPKSLKNAGVVAVPLIQRDNRSHGRTVQRSIKSVTIAIGRVTTKGSVKSRNQPTLQEIPRINPPQLEDIPSEASVSFAFGAQGFRLGQEPTNQT